jgi:hypothetical protein
MKRNVTIKALLQRERRLRPKGGAAAPAAVFTRAVRRRVRAPGRTRIGSVGDRRATWRATIDRLSASPRERP